MLLVLYVTVYILLFTTHAKKNSHFGPSCFGRSGCVTRFEGGSSENITNSTETATTENVIPKRYIVLEEFKSPIFGAYKYDPLLDDFIMPNKTAADRDANELLAATSMVMRAADDDDKMEETGNDNTTQANIESESTTAFNNVTISS